MNELNYIVYNEYNEFVAVYPTLKEACQKAKLIHGDAYVVATDGSEGFDCDEWE